MASSVVFPLAYLAARYINPVVEKILKPIMAGNFKRKPWPTLRAFNPDVFIRCAFCNLIVPLADLFGRNPRSEIEYTAELLNYLSFLHTSNCNGYSCIRHLYDPPLSVAAESLSVVSNDYESQNGTRNTLLFYF